MIAELVNDVDDDGIIDRFVLLPLIDCLARSQLSLSLSPVSISELRVPSTADLSTDCHCHFQSSPSPLNFITFAGILPGIQALSLPIHLFTSSSHFQFSSIRPAPPVNTISATDGQSGVSEQMMADQLQEEKISRGKLGRSSTAASSSTAIANTRMPPICSIESSVLSELSKS